MRISVFGLGYVGCVSAACLADLGHDVVGVDLNEEKVAMVNAGTSPIVEPGLKELIGKVVGEGRLKATTSTGEAIYRTDLSLISVGTPGYANGQLDVDALRRVGEEIGRVLREFGNPYTVVVRSTVLPGTTEAVMVPALMEGMGDRFQSRIRVAVNPEFLREGSAIRDFSEPPLTLVGCNEPETADLLRSMYSGVSASFIHTNIKTAEMVKYVANAYHALKVCFANEIGDLSESFGADGQEVMRIFRMDRKLNISEAYLRPGFAFGGSCLPKDLRAILYAARRNDVTLPLLSAIFPSNESQILGAVKAVLGARKRRVGVAGLSFKPGTDDLRESPMVTFVETLIGKGCDVRILDRNVSIARLVGANRRYIENEIPHISSLMCESPEALVAHADILVIGNASEEASQVLALADPGQEVIDLTRGEVRRYQRMAVEA